MAETRNRWMPVTEARAKLADVIDTLDTEPVVTLLRRSRPAALLVHPDHYNALLEAVEHAEAQAAVLYAQLHPDESISQEKLEAELGLAVS